MSHNSKYYRDRQIHKPQVPRKRGEKLALSCLQQAEERNFFTSFSRNLGFVDLPIPVLQESLSRFALAKLALSNFIQVVHEYRFKPGTERVPTRPYTCRHNTICMGRTHEIAFRGGPPLSLSPPLEKFQRYISIFAFRRDRLLTHRRATPSGLNSPLCTAQSCE